MTTMCVAGGTGRVGHEVVRLAVASGHKVSVLSRNSPPVGSPRHVDGAEYFEGNVTTGEGLPAALAGADVVIDCLEGQFGRALKRFADGGARLLAAAELAGARKAVALSIINCDLTSFPYYSSKAAKERKYSGSNLQTVVVRATQFHSLVTGIFAAGAKVRVIPSIRGVSFQPISPADVAGVLLQSAVDNSPSEKHRMLTVAGPQVLTMREMAQSWKSITGARGSIIELPLPGSLGKFLRSGHNLSPEPPYGQETFVSWLEKRRESL